MLVLIRSALILSLFFLPAYGQSKTDKETVQHALQVVETVITLSGSLGDKMATVRVKSKGAGLLWRSNPDRARLIFQSLWGWVTSLEEDGFDREQAYVEILKNLYPNDPAIADDLLSSIQRGKKDQEASLVSQMRGSDPSLARLNKLALELADDDPAMAVKLLDKSLAVSITPLSVSALNRLRQDDYNVADLLAAKAINGMRGRPQLIAMPGLHLMADYVFPVNPGQGMVMSNLPPPDVALRSAYFSAVYDVLKASLASADPRLPKGEEYAERDRKFISIYQGLLSAVASALSPEYAPDRVEELNKMSASLMSNIPPSVVPMAKYTYDRLRKASVAWDQSALSVLTVLATGDYKEARRINNALPDEAAKKALERFILDAELKQYIADSQLAEALFLAEIREDPNLLLIYYKQIAKAAKSKGENEFARYIISRAHKFLTEAGIRDFKFKSLIGFSLAATATDINPDKAVEILQEAVTSFNYLSGTELLEDQKSKQRIKVSSQAIRGSAEFRQAFRQAGQVKWDNTIEISESFTDRETTLMAKLFASESWIKKPVGASTEKPRP